MKLKLLIAVVLGVCAWGAMRHFSAPKDAIGKLMVVPRSFPAGSTGGMEAIVPVSGLSGHCQRGRYTVFVFSWWRCPGCRLLEARLDWFTRRRPDVAIRIIRLADGWRPQALKGQFGVNVRSVPHVVIYGRGGRLLAWDDGDDKTGLQTLTKWFVAVSAVERPGRT